MEPTKEMKSNTWDSTKSGIESLKTLKNEGKDIAKSTFNKAKDVAEDAADKASNAVQSTLDSGRLDQIKAKYQEISERAGTAFEASTDFVKKYPVQTVLGATAIGVAFGMLLRRGSKDLTKH